MTAFKARFMRYNRTQLNTNAMRLRLILIVLFSLAIGSVMAQSKNKKKGNANAVKQKNKQGPNSFEPFSTKEFNEGQENIKRKKSQKGKKSPSLNQTFDAKVEEFEKRLIANAKKYKKMERAMKKPQYSDPSYFGHKRKPKIRKVGKRKFCKECGIVH